MGGEGPTELEVDFDRSTPMTEALRVMAIGGVMRQAIKLVRGYQIRQGGGEFVMDVTSAIPLFKRAAAPTPAVRERSMLNGAVCANRRRGWRPGGTRGAASAAARGALAVRLESDDPLGGAGVDTFRMPAPDELVVDTAVTASTGEAAEFRQVYSRRRP